MAHTQLHSLSPKDLQHLLQTLSALEEHNFQANQTLLVVLLFRDMFHVAIDNARRLGALTWRRSFSHAFSLAATTSVGSPAASAMISSKRDSSSARTSKGCICTHMQTHYRHGGYWN